MKYLLLIFAYSISLFAQTNEIKSSVMDFFQSLDEIPQYYDKERNTLSEPFSKEKIDDMVAKYYMTIAQDHIAYKTQLIKRNYDYAEKKRINEDIEELQPSLKLGLYLEVLKKNFSPEFVKIIGIPYYMRLKIIDVENTIYITTDNNQLPQISLICQIEDVVKGPNQFKEKEIIEVSYLQSWFDCEKRFEVGKSYFMPLTLRGCNLDTCNYITLQELPDGYCALYEIENEQIISPNNYFGFDEKLSWSNFRNNFTNKYILETK